MQTLFPTSIQSGIIHDTPGVPGHEVLAQEIRTTVLNGHPAIIHAGAEMLWAALAACVEAGRKTQYVWIDRLRTKKVTGHVAQADILKPSPADICGARINPLSFGDTQNQTRFLMSLTKLGSMFGIELPKTLHQETESLIARLTTEVLPNSAAPYVTLAWLSDQFVHPDSDFIKIVRDWKTGTRSLLPGQHGQILQYLQVVFSHFGALETRSGGDQNFTPVDPIDLLKKNSIIAFPGEGAGQDGDEYDIYMREVILKLIDATSHVPFLPKPTLFTGMGTWHSRLDETVVEHLCACGVRHISLSPRLFEHLPHSISSLFEAVISAPSPDMPARSLTLMHGSATQRISYSPWPERYAFGEELPDMYST